MNTHVSTNEDRWLNPDVLRWARLRRGRTREDAARRLRKNTEDIAAWENGEKTPTVKQARTLAEFYDRPFLELLLPHPPEIQEPVALPDFRMHRDTLPPSEDWDFRHIQQWAETQRINALDLYQVIGEEPPAFPKELFATVANDPAEIAARTRDILDFPIERQLEMTQQEATKLPELLRHLFESIGILTFKKTELTKFKVRGICIADFPLPVIVIAKESPTAQAFSLAHELGHVLLRATGISGSIERGIWLRDIEEWCNRFAGAFLVPEVSLQTLMGSRPTTPTARIADDELNRIARTFRVSPHAMLIRLMHLGYIAPDYYWNVKKPEFDAQEREYSGGGRPTYYGSRYRSRQGDLYTGLVLEAWSSGRVTNHNAAEYMGIKNLIHLDAIRDHFGGA